MNAAVWWNPTICGSWCVYTSEMVEPTRFCCRWRLELLLQKVEVALHIQLLAAPVHRPADAAAVVLRQLAALCAPWSNATCPSVYTRGVKYSSCSASAWKMLVSVNTSGVGGVVGGITGCVVLAVGLGHVELVRSRAGSHGTVGIARTRAIAPLNGPVFVERTKLAPAVIVPFHPYKAPGCFSRSRS